MKLAAPAPAAAPRRLGPRRSGFLRKIALTAGLAVLADRLVFQRVGSTLERYASGIGRCGGRRVAASGFDSRHSGM